MEVNFSFVPPGGGEQDYTAHVDLPAIPREGDYLAISCAELEGRHDNGAQHSFIVRRTWWNLKRTESGTSFKELWVEAEMASSPYDCDAHKSSLEMYRVRGKEPRKFEASAY